MPHDHPVIGRLARRAFDLFVTGMTNHHQMMALLRIFLNLNVNLGDQGTGGVDGLQAALPGGMNHRARDAMRTEHRHGAHRHVF